LVNEALQLLQKSYPSTPIPNMSPMLTYEMLFECDEPAPTPEELPLTNTEPADLAIYFHSSGSTAFPKPIPISNRHFIEYSACSHFGERDFCGKILGLQVMPVFHAMGALQTGLAATTGLALSTFEPKFPATSPTAENFMEAAVRTKSDYLFSVPVFIEVREYGPRSSHISLMIMQ
jgi:acyl-coenzyme A synthetase/AMP-(fatty) acid ligase